MTNSAELLSVAMRQELQGLDAALMGRRAQNQPALLEAGRRYADWVTSEEPVHFDDYQAMLAARDAIQGVVARASLPTARVLEALVAHHDSIFFLGTRLDDGGLLRAGRWSERASLGWCWGRVPNRLDMTGVEPGGCR